VIVGLARASQSAPIVRRRRDESVARQMPVLEPTRQMAGEDARRMLERMEMERREREAHESEDAERRMRENSEARRLREQSQARRMREAQAREALARATREPREPRLPLGPGPAPAPIGSLHLEDPISPPGYGQNAPLHLDEEDTHNLTQEQARSLVPAGHAPPAGRRRDRDAFDEPTRAVDWGTMDDLAARGSPPGGRKPPSPPPTIRGHAPVAGRTAGGMTRRPDEDTRSVELKRIPSLSEVDWDLDS
jgi:hypothetical protein